MPVKRNFNVIWVNCFMCQNVTSERFPTSLLRKCKKKSKTKSEDFFVAWLIKVYLFNYSFDVYDRGIYC